MIPGGDARVAGGGMAYHQPILCTFVRDGKLPTGTPA